MTASNHIPQGSGGQPPGVGRRAPSAPPRERGAAQPTPRAAGPASLGYVVARRHAVSGTATSRSARMTHPTVPTILLPFKITVKGAPAARRCSAPQTLEQ